MKDKMVILSQLEQHKLQMRINKIKGQLTSIENMLASPFASPETLQQLAAINGGLRSLMREILEISVRSEVAHMQQHNAAQEANELIFLMRSFLK